MIRVVKTMKDPRWLIGMLWPLVLAVPYLPGIPRPAAGGFAWRQEFAFAVLLVATSGLLLRRKSLSNFGFSALPQNRSLFLTGILFVFWISASVVWAENKYSAAHYAFTWGSYIVFFALMHLVAARPRVLRASFYSLGGIVWLLSLSCVIEWLGGAALTDHWLRATVKPLFRGFSGFGEMLAVAVPIFGALALSVRRRRQAVLCGATSLIGWLGILLALQRAPILGAAMGFLLLGIGVLVFKGCQPRNKQRVAMLFASVVVIAVVQFVGLTAIAGDNSSVGQRLQATSLSEGNTQARLLYWGVGIEMFRAHPLAGVGANNYEVAFPKAREKFAAAHDGSSLIVLNEHLLTQYAHNEYVQILAELGIVGIAIFAAFCIFLVRAFWKALHTAKRPLLALGAGAGLLAFHLSSGASAFSFRWFGGGLVCFFAAALVSYLASPVHQKQPAPNTLLQPSFVRIRLVPVGVFAFAVVMILAAGMQGLNSVTHAWAQASNSPVQAENLYRRSLHLNPFDAATHFDYGSFLYQQRRYHEAVAQLQYAVDHGFSTSTSYAALAAAQEEGGDLAASERTLAIACRTYPQSVFLLVRHAAALSRQGRNAESDGQLAKASAIDERSARGWYQLINFDIDATLIAGQKDSTITMPGDLLPEKAVFLVLKENERRMNIPAGSGWRSRVGSLAN